MTRIDMIAEILLSALSANEGDEEQRGDDADHQDDAEYDSES